MNAARLAARALELLGPHEGPIILEAPCAKRLAGAIAATSAIARSEDIPAAAVIAFLGTSASPSERQATIGRLRDRLPAGAPVVVIDHNQPRTPWQRALSLPSLLVSGLTPARARYPVAQELATHGFAIRSLRLANGERFQLVSAIRK